MVDKNTLIIEMLLNTDLAAKTIAKEVGVSVSQVSYVNKGVRGFKEDLNYPLRKSKKERNKEIYDMHLDGVDADLIAEKYGVSRGHVFAILREQGIRTRVFKEDKNK